ncbi:MAG: hypothetical protein ACREO5_00805 [Candidatus Binatia bacterium]
MNLEKQIEEVSQAYPEKDPRVIAAKQRLKDFETKQGDLGTQLERMQVDHQDLEKQSAAAMLSGADPKIQRLTALSNRKIEAEAEHRILGSVIEQARTQVKETTSSVKSAWELSQWKIVSAAVDRFVATLEPVLEAQEVLAKALSLPVGIQWGSYRESDLRNIREAHHNFSEFQKIIADIMERSK